MDELRKLVRKFGAKPHDGFFKGLVGDVRLTPVLLVQLESARGPGWAPQIDLDNLQLAPGSFVDAELRQKHTDLLFTAPLLKRPEACIYLLFEHLSTPDRTIQERAFAYFGQIARAHARSDVAVASHAEILGVVLYTGNRRWRLASPRHAPIFGNPQIVDVRELLAQPWDEVSLPSVAAKLACLLFASVGTSELLSMIEKNAELFRRLVADSYYRLHHFPLHLIYIQKTTEAVMAEAAINKLEELVPEVARDRRTLYEVQHEASLEEGRLEGRAEGRLEALEGLRTALRALLRVRELAPTRTQSNRIDACTDVDQLTRWIERAASATSVEGVVG